MVCRVAVEAFPAVVGCCILVALSISLRVIYAFMPGVEYLMGDKLQ